LARIPILINEVKLAVLLSGSYRNIEDIWPKNKKILDAMEVPYDVFFHTWRQNADLNSSVLEIKHQNKFYFSLFPKVYQSFPKNISRNDVWEKFGFYSIQVADLKEGQIASEFNLGDRHSNRLFQTHINSCGMYLGIDSCAKEVFKLTGYTHFLRVRPDFELDPRTIMYVFDNDLVFFGQLLPTEEGMIGDQCYGGDLATSGFILSTLEKLYEITGAQEWDISTPVVLAENVIRLTLKPHRNLKKILFCEGSGSIQRPEVKIAISEFGIQFLVAVVRHNAVVGKVRLRRLLHFFGAKP
jgi:hypothetical protein